MTSVADAQSKFLQALLIQLCSGRALQMMKMVEPPNGWVAWRRLCREYEPPSHGRWVAMLVGLLSPEWSSTTPFWDQLLQWEAALMKYEAQSNVKVPDEIRCAVIAKHAPQKVKDYIRNCPLDLLSSYALLKETLHQYIVRGRSYSSSGAQVEASVPMELDVVLQGRRPPSGRGRGRGRGKGQQQQQQQQQQRQPQQQQQQQQSRGRGGGRSGQMSASGPQRQQERTGIQPPTRGTMPPRSSTGGMPSFPRSSESAASPSSEFTGKCYRCGQRGPVSYTHLTLPTKRIV